MTYKVGFDFSSAFTNAEVDVSYILHKRVFNLPILTSIQICGMDHEWFTVSLKNTRVAVLVFSHIACIRGVGELRLVIIDVNDVYSDAGPRNDLIARTSVNPKHTFVEILSIENILWNWNKVFTGMVWLWTYFLQKLRY